MTNIIKDVKRYKEWTKVHNTLFGYEYKTIKRELYSSNAIYNIH